MDMDSVNQHLKALEFFKDWSNFLLVTTTAALGWLATSPVTVSTRRYCVWFFALSVVFAVFTLALIPLVGEQLTPKTTSIYAVSASFRRFWLWGPESSLSLKAVCFPQHVLFLLGIVAYAIGASRKVKPTDT